MKSIRKKHMVVLLLVTVVIAAGILQYNYNKNNLSSGVTGDNLDSDFVSGDVQVRDADQVSNQESGASIEANSFFAQARLDREIELSKNASYLKELSTTASVDKTIQDQAYEEFVKLMELSELRTRIESMIKEKNFEDVFVAIGDDGSVDVVVKTPSLTQSQVAQISDIVSRQANVELSMIHIRPLY
jgi:stage III sporulation protein AH